jgi:regulator of sirC expression with transglutaminase-like and TPR domain
MQALRKALRGDPAIPIDEAALDLARIEFPQLSMGPYLDTLDAFAAEIWRRTGQRSGALFVGVSIDYLFGELGFRGNESDYYNPRNSCLNCVLDERIGIPITLSLVFLAVARRLGQPVCGIGLPGHFVLKYQSADYCTYIDPFHRGRLLTESDCRELAGQFVPAPLIQDPALFEPVADRHILMRMLKNLCGAYLRSASYEQAVTAASLLIEADPRIADSYKSRAVAQLKLGRLAPARADLEAYLKYAPDASDRAEVVQQVEAIHRRLASLN